MNRLLAILGLLWCLGASAAEVIPPAPEHYFNDYAGVVSPSVSGQLNQKLADFERATSSQVVVAIFSKMQSDSSIDDYAVRVFRAWKVGQKDKNNGVVLFVFVQDHRMRIQTGYGMEGALPDALCKRIIDQEIAPRFKEGNFDAGLTAGVNAILAATKGEYKGSGNTVADRIFNSQQDSTQLIEFIFWAVVIGIILIWIFSGRSGRGGWFFYGGGGGWSSGGGGWSSGGGGGGFSGGGGSTGGGGASGSW